MKFKSLLAGLCLLGYVTAAQVVTPQIIPVNSYDSKLCANTQGRIPVQVIGSFNADNRFYVELLSYDSDQPLARYEAVLKYGALLFDIGGDVAENYNRIKYRILTTSPVSPASIYSNNWFTRGEISLARPVGTSDTLNAGMGYTLNVNMNSNNPVTVTLSDSSVQEIGPSNYYQQAISLVASKTTEIFIVRAVNSCHVPVPFSGKVPVVVNPITITPLRVNNLTKLCEGGDIELSYAVSGGAIPESARFRLRFFKPYPNVGEQQIFEVTATKKSDGVLIARIPEKMVSYSNTFHIAVLVDKPGLVSSYLKSATIYDKPTVSFQSQSGSVQIGQAVDLRFAIEGPEPYTIELNNGKSYLLDGNRNINVYPTQTEIFSIRSLRTACGVTTDVPKQTVVARVPPGIAIHAAREQTWSICENQRLRLPFVTNAALTASTKIIVEGRTYKDKLYQFEGKIVNDSIEFLIPHSPETWIDEGYFNIKYFRIRTTSPELVSEYVSGFNIRGIPRVSYESRQGVILTGKQYYEYDLHVSGGTPYTVTDEQGYRTSAEYVPLGQKIFVPATGTYGPKSVFNGCYTNSEPAKVSLTVNAYTSQQPVIVVHPSSQKYLCGPDSVEVYFEAFGKFAAGNEFQIIRGDNPGAPWLTVTKPGRYKIPASLLNQNAYSGVLIRSTQPQVEAGSELPIIFDTKPVLLYPGELGGPGADRPRVFNLDERPYIYTQLNSYSPYTAEYTDGTKDYHFEQVLQYDAFRPAMPRSKVVAFTLKSLTNACGTTEVNHTVYLFWKGYNLSMKYFPDDKAFCAGQELVVGFEVSGGVAPAGTSYLLQVSKDASTYTTIATKSVVEDFRYTIPASMEGEYFVRIMTDAGISAGGNRIYVNKIPTATLSSDNQSNAEIDYGQPVYINYILTGAGPWELIVKDRGDFTATTSPASVSYQLSKGTVFELQSVSNQCGFGTVSGSVPVRIKPQIVTFQTEATSLCSGQGLNVTYKVAGDIPPGEKIVFFLKNMNDTRFDLMSVNAVSGTMTIPMPAGLPGGSYQLVCGVSGSELSESRLITLLSTPDIELTGNTTINAGESANLLFRATNEGNIPLDVVLSDGTRFSFSSWGSGTAYYASVKPSVTTTYSIRSATGSCGAAKVSGSATVTVNAAAARTVRVTGLNKSMLCEKDTLNVYFVTSGTFSQNNSFSVRFYDSQGKLVTTVPSTGKASPLAIVVPSGFLTTETYRIRITASDANTASSDSPVGLGSGTKATAAFAGSEALLDENGNARAVVLLTGTGPWRYDYGNDLRAVSRYADRSPDTLLISSKEPSAYFKLLSVSNGCGIGMVTQPSSVLVTVILGAEEPGVVAEPITFGPNPTRERVQLHFKTSHKRTLTLYGANGQVIWTKSITATDAEVDMLHHPSGSYLLKIEHPKGKQVVRIVKE
ncbi:T9SS type A sorting domain-containing protein [Dyadobacter sandarakinus]|uniref:T9SS type A sorting domain-containing protein n=1 Tax=Dyadobacter sandarakinus TaxID=2747268 RepID=A0ABX7I3X6_9BACT|nr:T9SS type A sorting domain-containing protein [Dyadobacter sandarakinus]QRR00774.1 T9SS type A sorting domain-containing protein [Dyadobacter sandarakinus]